MDTMLKQGTPSAAGEKVQVMVVDDGSPNIPLDPPKTENGNLTEEEQKWMDDRRNALMVVAVMIATLTFQAAINPPGGLWQDWKNYKNQPSSPSPTYDYEPGESVNQDMHYQFFICFMFFNGVGLVASLSIIILLTDAVRIKDKWQVWVLLVTMWVCVTSVAVAFIFGIKLIMHDYSFSVTTAIIFLVMFSGIVFLGNLYRLGRYLNEKKNKNGQGTK